MKAKVVDLNNKSAGEIDLDEAIFGVEVRRDILARVVNWQRAKRRAGTHKAKRISDIAGSTRKPWRQKGLGRARAGTTRATQFRGGAAMFGPVPRDHGFRLNKKVRRLGMCCALSSKQADGKLVILDKAEMKMPKTGALVASLGKMGTGSVLIIDGPEPDLNFRRAAQNIPNVDVLPQQGANVYDILRRDFLVLTRDAVQHLEARLR